MSDDAFFEFGIGQNDDKVGKKITRFSAEKRTYRIGFSNWDGITEEENLDAAMITVLRSMTTPEGMEEPVTPKFIGAPRHFVPGVGYFLHKGPAYAELSGEAPKTYVATIIIVWPSDNNGVVSKDSLKRMPDIHPWVFNKEKYQPISVAHRQWPFGEYDLLVTCSDTQYQKMSFVPAKGSLFRSFIERALGDEILVKEFGKGLSGDLRPPDEKSREIVDYILTVSREIRSGLRDYIARDLTLEQIREKQGGAPAPSTGTTAPVADAEVDDLLGDILDDE